MGGNTWKCVVLLYFLTNLNTLYGFNNTYTMYEVRTFTELERYVLDVMHKQYKQVSILNGITSEAALPVHIAVDDCCLNAFSDFLNQFTVSYVKTYRIRNTYLHEEFSGLDITKSFLTWDSMQKWFIETERKYPYLLTRIVIGHTFEKREIIVFKVSKNRNYPAIFMLGGEEGRDWMSPAIVLNLMKNVLEYNRNGLIDLYDCYFLPVLNPDGYEYSRTKERFWTKNRRDIFPKLLCPDNSVPMGVNIDRNWFKAAKGDVRDCNPIYDGHKPLSEEETFTLSLFLDTIAPRIIAFFNLRGFDHIITTPYASKKMVANNHNTIMEIINYACENLKRKYNVSYTYGSTASLFFNRSGSCADWVKENLNVPMVATIYLKHGGAVVTDHSDILPVYRQSVSLLVDMLNLTRDLYGPLFNSQDQHTSLHFTLIILLVCVSL